MTDFVVFGSGGQLGSELVTLLEGRGHEVHGVDRSECDVSSPDAVKRVLRKHQPRAVFNAASFSDVDQAESVRKAAMSVNGVGAGIVAAASRDVGAINVFFSSHLVFGDGHTSPIDESREPAPLNNYGQTKLFGERLVVRNCPRSFVVRSGALYSRFGTNIIRRLTQIALAGKKTITVVDDETINPTPAYLVAQTAIELATEESVFGTYHAAATGSCSWHQFVSTFVARLELDVDVQAISSDRWGAPARRPTYSVLDNMMLRCVGRDNFAPWEDALDAFLETNGEKIIWEMS